MECHPLSISFEGYNRIEARSKYAHRSKRLRQAMQEDVILFPDPRVRLSAIGDSAVDRDPTLQSACVALCEGLQPSQWVVEDYYWVPPVRA